MSPLRLAFASIAAIIKPVFSETKIFATVQVEFRDSLNIFFPMNRDHS